MPMPLKQMEERMITTNSQFSILAYACMSVLAGVLMLASGAKADVQPSKDQPEPRVFSDAEGATMPYLLLKPKDYDPQMHYPLVVFYHGAGERGDDNHAQWRNGVEVFQKPENREKFLCFVIAPQCPAGKQWVNVPWGDDSEVQPAEPSRQLKLSLAILKSIEHEFPIDEKRLYVAGLSMGGFATWDVITRYPDLFAAAVPVCGGGDEKQAGKIKDLPIWAFHGGADTTVKTIRSRNMIAAIKEAGGHPKYTEYPGVGHGSWGPAFKEPELLKWMFEQKRK
jgi:predicted peptidase